MGGEWYLQYSDLKDILDKHCNKDKRVLHVGCGSSTLGEEMYKDGYSHQDNIDFSDIVIQ